jgi:hypothetical protein
MNEHEDAELHKAMFQALVLSVAQSAMVHLGKLVNPVVRRTEVNLEGAQESIDLLDMIAAKTKGNLDDAELRMLKTTISDLKLNYFQTATAAPTPPEAPAAAPAPEKPAEAAAEPPAAEPPAEPGPEKKDAPEAGTPDSKVRYRKTFD